jgi:hypothetical protein
MFEDGENKKAFPWMRKGFLFDNQFFKRNQQR